MPSSLDPGRCGEEFHSCNYPFQIESKVAARPARKRRSISCGQRFHSSNFPVKVTNERGHYVNQA
jgi:hypothetical protein